MFSSNSSKNKAEATVNKLLGDLLPNVPQKSEKKITKSSKVKTKLLSNQFDLTIEPINTKKFKLQRNQKIKKFNNSNKKFEKLTKYTIIKESSKTSLNPNHEKYLQKLVNRNINLLNKNEIEDLNINDQLNELKEEILPKLIKPKQKSSKRVLYSKNLEFDKKVQKGWISMPGLTPGLAPVDYNEESD